MASAILRSRFVSVLFLAAMLLMLFVNIKAPFNFYDEGFAVVGGERVMNGEIPYKDFWAIYPPGQFYLLAGMFKLFGNNLMVSRVLDTLVRFMIVVCVFGILDRTTSRWLALLMTFLVTTMLAAVGFYSYAVFPALALNLAAFLFFITFTNTYRKGWLAAAGAFVGAASLVRWDLGAYAAISLSAATVLFAFLRVWQAPALPGDFAAAGRAKFFPTLGNALKDWLPFLAGFLSVALVGYGLIILRGGWDNVIDQLFVFPLTTFREVRWLPYPALNPFDNATLRPWYEFYLPLLLFAAAFIYYAIRLFRRTADLEGSIVALGLAGFGSMLFAQALSRYDYIHVLPSTILALMVATLIFHHLRADYQTGFTRVAVPVMLAILVAMYLLPTRQPITTALDHYHPLGCYSTAEKAACVVIAPEQEQAAQLVQSLSQPDQRIYSGNLRHDSIFVNDVGFYYIADRLPGTRYHELHPGVATTLPVQEQIAADLDGQQVEIAVLADIWQSSEPNGSSESSSVYFLDEYLRANFEPVNQFGWYQIWRRK